MKFAHRIMLPILLLAALVGCSKVPAASTEKAMRIAA